MKPKTPTQRCSFFLLASAVCLLTFFFACEKDQSAISNGKPHPRPEINLTLAEEPYLTEIYLKLEMNNVEFPQAYTITRNSTAILTDTVTTTDTTVIDTGLTPSTSYYYEAYRLINGQKTDSASLQAATMDTTSHDFQWELIEIPSPYGSGLLRDVAIINEDDIWAVGEIYADSAQPWLPYNAVHWDGQQWGLKRIPTNSVVGIGYYPINTVFAFDSNNIWMFSDAGSYSHWNGTNWQTEYVPERQGGINKIWGSSPTDIYFVGTNGNITHYNGSSWQKIESETELNINDVWGNFDKKSGGYEILCVASNHLSDPTYSRKILRIEQNQVIELSSYPIQWTLYSIWFIPKVKYFVAGSGIYEKHQLTELQWQNGVFDITPYYMYRIRGNHINDVIAVGGFGEVVHFNGWSWKSFFNQSHISGNYYSVSLRGEIAVAVGYNSPNGVIAVGNQVHPE